MKKIYKTICFLIVLGTEIILCPQSIEAKSGKTINKEPLPVTNTRSSAIINKQVISAPSDMNIPDYYKKYINTNGIYIVSSEAVSDDALYKASEIIALMMSKRQDILQYMVNKGCHAMIIGKDEETCDLPEYAHMCNTPESIAYWNKRARGFGGGPEDDYSASCGEENLLALPEDRYVGENILIHEFAHIIHTVGILGLEPDFDSRLEDLWQNSIDNGRWENTYAISNKEEYFAEGVQSFFNSNRYSDPTNGIHGPVNNRERLKVYDPDLFFLLQEYFDEIEIPILNENHK